MASERQARARISFINLMGTRSLLSGTIGFLHLDEGGVVTVLLQCLAGPVQFLDARIRADAHTVPYAFVGQGGRLYRRLHTDQRKLGLEVVSVRGVLEGSGLQEKCLPLRRRRRRFLDFPCLLIGCRLLARKYL